VGALSRQVRKPLKITSAPVPSSNILQSNVGSIAATLKLLMRGSFWPAVWVKLGGIKSKRFLILYGISGLDDYLVM